MPTRLSLPHKALSSPQSPQRQSKKNTSKSIFQPSAYLAFFCTLAAFFNAPKPTTALTPKEARALFKKHQAQLRTGYREAIKLRYKEPCRTFNEIPTFLEQLEALQGQIPEKPLLAWQKKSLLRSVKSYQRSALRERTRAEGRCRSEWNAEWKRRPPKALSKACLQRFPNDPKQPALWIGVRPWAHVYLNELRCGIAPLKLTLPPGRYNIRLDFPPGRDSFQQTVVLREPTTYRRRTKLPPPVLVVRQMNTAPAPAKKQPNALSADQIRWVLQSHQSSLKACQIYQPQIQQVSLSWRITPKGKPEDIQWVAPSDAKERFQQCILRAATRWRFPQHRASANIQSYPISIQ